ncbi:MAG: PTS glucose transporter subunit IIA, partial [Bombilactobacillus sp.]|nr:PTS glucose transporter subunit IIA [Bombilactobacillus sp.]
VFASKSVGKGLAFIPSSNHVVAPFDGQVITVLPSQHAIGLRGENGVEVLIHIGLDTVKLNGKYFKMLVKNGERVKQGQKLLIADLKQIKNAGYVLESPVIITNPEQYQIEFNVKAGDLVQEQDQIMTVQ